MDGLPLDVDLNALVGCAVIQLRIEVGQLQIHFDNGDSVTVESAIVVTGTNDDARIDEYGPAASLLCRLLDDRVSGATREEDGGLRLRFASGTKLRVLNDSALFESLQVRVAGHLYVG